MNGIQIALPLNLFISIYLFLDPHISFHVGEELIKIFFLLFKHGIKLYMLTHVFLTLIGSKPIYLMTIIENNGWFLLLQVELEIELLL
jgi:hypothetical protein